AIHRRKEDYFWQTYMGISDDQAGATKAQTEWTHFLSQGSRIEEIRQQIAAAENISDSEQREQTLQGLNGWLAMFQAHAIESRQAQQLKNELI
ncbi:peptidase M3, partial [Escherichia coli]|nr:peptidase M3 [Escherichia coli]